MGWDSERELEKICLSCYKILRNFKILEISTKNGNEITDKDLRQAINIMEKKHLNCRWKYRKRRKNDTVILKEGYLWLIHVYFQNKQRQIDADIDFFITMIKEYEKVLKVPPKTLWDKDLYIDELEEYFNRSAGTIKNNIIKMNKATNGIYIYKRDGKYIISKQGIEWLCKNCFKQKYLELLEDYKMELTQKYMDEGYIYDNFLLRR